MNLAWIAVGVAAVVIAGAAAVMRLVAVGQRPPESADLGTVSAGWLSENRSRKDL